MTKSPTIPKKPKLEHSQDYYFLRSEGLKYLESIATKFWTDFNTHDPGITILEVLCYAITDLGYRSGFPMEDILARDPQSAENEHDFQFHTAREILTNRAFTETDYRKLLIDILGVDNAWLTKAERGEVKIFADCEESQLITTPLPDLEEVKLRGLYKVLLELGEDREVGDLNSALLTHKFSKGELKGMSVEVLLPRWSKENASLMAFAAAESLNSISLSEPELKKDYWRGNINLNFTWKGNNHSLLLEQVKVNIISNRLNREINLEKIESELTKTNPGAILPKFQKKLKRIGSLIDEARNKLMANRNLCEDFLDINTVPIEDVAICADVDLENDADLDEVQAHIYHELQNYFSPPIAAYTLKELMERGLQSDEIFQGPVLDHGFILDEELNDSKLGACLYTSDIINILMDIPGVKAVKNLMLTHYDEAGNRLAENRKWTLRITSGHKPRLSIAKSKFLLFKSEIPFIANAEETEQKLMMLEGLTERIALLDHEKDLPIPEGKLRKLEEHYTVQNEFPLTYGIGHKGLPLNESLSREQQNERIAQARQLKSYLLFFDQLLANYLSQLSNIKNLYSWKESDHTYFSQYLKNISGVEGDFEEDFYIDALKLEEAIKGDLFEDSHLYEKRRNRFLNHLIARFAEQFADYAALMHVVKGSGASDELIRDKVNFLKDYPQLSSERGKGFNYSDENELWNSSNVSGFEKRISRLLGFDDFFRRKLQCGDLNDVFETYKDVEDQFRFRIRTYFGNVLFRSEGYTQEGSIKNGIASVKENGVQDEQYRREEAGDGSYYFNLVAKNNKIIGTSMFHASAAARDKNIEELKKLLQDNCHEEGMHLVEHLLLRPGTTDDQLMEVCLDKNCQTCGEEDPYSFRVSVILPYWPQRFRSMEFRRFAERTMRMEIPAHLGLKICWVDQEQMQSFETAWRAWLEEQVKEKPNPVDLKNKLGDLISILQDLHNIHPQAHLHDCEDSDYENPVMLGNTVLGQFKPLEDES